MAAQGGGFLSGVVFGYVAKISGSYDWPLILMAAVLGLGSLTWLKIDPLEELAPEDRARSGRPGGRDPGTDGRQRRMHRGGAGFPVNAA